MATFLFDKIIFGPVKSRRLGISLGINLMPVDNKLCNYNCIYCECGWNRGGQMPKHNPVDVVADKLREKLIEMTTEGQLPDVITFAGNGEPTMHPDFEKIIDSTITLRDQFAPKAKVAVLTNGTMIGRESVRKALMKVDRNIVKLDSGFDSTVETINKPNGRMSVEEKVKLMKLFDGKLIIQTMFLRGEYEGKIIDNTTEVEVSKWLEYVKEVKPQQVMIYTIDRDTPADNLEKVSVEDMKKIAERVENLGIECSVSG